MLPLSVLDLSPVAEGSDVGQAIRNTVDLARHAERLGFHRYWLAEHHNMPGIASAATSLVIGEVARATQTIRVGAGGIMLPNHAPLVIAEQFGTLAALHPGRIDLGVGRAPGTDQMTARALRRTLVGGVYPGPDRPGAGSGVDRFPQDVVELMAYFEPAKPGQLVRAVPGEGARVPVWILGSSLFGAQLAALLGLPYAFASHFAPAQMEEAIALYREQFRASEHLARPYVMLGLNLVAAETDAAAVRLFTSIQQAFLNLRTGRVGRLPAPVDDIEAVFAEAGAAPMLLQGALAQAVVGSPATVREDLDAFIARHRPDEVIVTSQIWDHAARVRSYEILAEVREEMARAA
jgi:luciferase family oxidoreductase group 1